MHFTPPSPAERTILVSSCGLFASGALLGYEALEGLQAMVEFVGPTAGEWISTLCAGVGALIAIGLMRERFGLSGWQGRLQLSFGCFIATMLLGVVAGTFVLPLFGTMFGPWLILSTVVEKPWLLLPWALALYAHHLAMREYRAEQDTIFRWLPRIDAI